MRSLGVYVKMFDYKDMTFAEVVDVMKENTGFQELSSSIYKEFMIELLDVMAYRNGYDLVGYVGGYATFKDSRDSEKEVVINIDDDFIRTTYFENVYFDNLENFFKREIENQGV